MRKVLLEAKRCSWDCSICQRETINYVSVEVEDLDETAYYYECQWCGAEFVSGKETGFVFTFFE